MNPLRNVIALTACLAFAPLSAAGPRVDLSPDNGRADVLSPGWENWRVPEKQSASTKFGDVTVTLRAVEPNAKLTTGWWKPGFDYPARMASDGVIVSGTL